MAAKRQIDWEKIEEQFRVGKLSIRAIAAEHGITEGAIRRRARETGWQRDLSDKVRRAVRRELVRSSVRAVCGPEKCAQEREIVEAAAAEGVSIVLKHQRFLARMLNIGDKMLTDIEKLMSDGESPTQLVGALDILSRVVGRSFPLEREAHGLDDKEQATSDDEKTVIVLPSNGRE